MLPPDPQQATVVATTDSTWRSLELSWSSGQANAEPAGWRLAGFDDSSWSAGYVPADPNWAWADIAGADYLSSAGRATGHIDGEAWIARREFQVAGAVAGDGVMVWNVDDRASVWVNGNRLLTSAGEWQSVHTTSIPAAMLHAGTNAVAVEVWNSPGSGDWGANPTMFQANLYTCDPGCDQDDPAAVIPSPAQWLPSGNDATHERWSGTGSQFGTYVSRSASPLDFTVKLGKYLGPVDANGHPAPGHALYNQWVDLFIQAYDVDSACGSPPCEKDTVTVNGVSVRGQLEGVNDGYHTTMMIVDASALVFRSSYLDEAGGVNHIQVAADQQSTTDHWYLAVSAVSFSLPPAPEIYRPTVLIHGLFDKGQQLMVPLYTEFHNGGVDESALKVVEHDSLPFPAGLAQIEEIVDPFIASTGWDRVNIVGHSLGGLYARLYAASHPFMVKTVVMLGTPNGGIEPLEMGCDAWNTVVRWEPKLCDETHPIFRQLTAAFVRGDLRNAAPDLPWVRYLTIAGDSNDGRGTCIGEWGPLLYHYLYLGALPNDSCVTVSSAQWMAAFSGHGGREDGPQTPYHLNHHELVLAGSQTVADVNCWLYHPSAACPWPSAQPAAAAAPMSGSGATAESQEIVLATSAAVPAGGYVDVPVAFEGTSVAVIDAIVPDGQVSATIGGTTLTPVATDQLHSLDATLTQPSDGSLRISNSGATTATVAVFASILSDRHVTVDAPAFITRGSPLAVTVTIANSIAGDSPTAKLIDPSGAETAIALTSAGADTWTATLTPVVAGRNRILVTLAGSRFRIGAASIDVGRETSTVSRTFSEWLADSNGDGLAESLELQPTVSVGEAGSYALVGHLVDGSSTEIGVARDSATLAAGATWYPALRFDASLIRENGAAGPYRLVDVTLVDETAAVTQAVVPSANPTAAYSLEAFQHDTIAFDPAALSVTPIDDNNDGTMDRWQVGGTVTVDAPGSYTIESGLVAADGQVVAQATATAPFAAGANALTLDFDGAAILASGLPGPYAPADFTVRVADRAQPLSSFVQSSPAYVSSAAGTATLKVRASMPAISGTVEVWQRFEAQGSSSFGPWTLGASSQVDSGTPSIAVPIGSVLGTYEFYAVAVDGASLAREAIPAAADTTTVVAAAPSLSLEFTNNFKGSHDFTVGYWASYSSGSGWARLWMQGAVVSTADASPFAVHADADGTYYITAAGCDELTGLCSASSGKYICVDTVPPASSAGPVPAATTSTSLSIPYTASDSSGQGIWMTEVWQRFQAAGSSTWTEWAQAATGSTSPIAVTLAYGSGRYEFYSIAVDWAGNREAPPDAADAFTVLDAGPATAAGPLPAAVHLTTLSVPYAGTDDPAVELWQRFEAAGSTTFSAWAQVATGAASPFSVALGSGDGRYEFYTVGVKGSLREANPAVADAFTVLDTAAPASAAGSLPAAVRTAALSVPYTASDNANGSGLAPVELWQRFEAAGSSTWSAWAMAKTATRSPAAVPLGSGDGRYEFYTVAVDAAGNREAAPASADAFTVLDTAAPTTAASALPAAVKSTTLSVPFASADGGGSGLASVELWQRFSAAGSGTWSSWAKRTTTAASPFSVTLASGNGGYEFYTVGVDAAGNREAAPATADASTVLDSVAPVTAAAALPASVSSTALAVPFTAADTNGSGVASVELWRRFQAAGSGIWSAWASAASGTSSPFGVTLGSGDGRYEFYTIGVDAATNREAAPSSADAFTVLSTTPASAASALTTPVRSTSVSVAYTATLSASVELWRRYRAAGSTTWSAWSKVATATSSPIGTTLPSGDGRYEFYTIGISSGGTREAAPASADAYTDLDTGAPTSTVGAVPSTSSASSLSIPFTAADNANGTGIASTELWSRYRASDAVATGTWTLVASGTGPSGSITLPFASGAGVYDIATISVDLAGNREGGLAQPSTAKSLVRAVTWGASVKVNTDTGTALQDNPACALGPDGTAYCVWEDSRSGNADIWFAQRNPSTGVWSGEMKLNTDVGTKAQTTPAIAVDGSGNLYVVWADERNTAGTANTDIYFTKRTGTTWSANTMLNADATTSVQSQPRIAVSSAGIAVAVWLDLRGGQKNIYSARLPAGSTTWSANYKVTSNTAAAKAHPDVAVATDGTAHAVWEDATSGNADVDYATLAPAATTWSTNVKISDDATTGAESFPRIGLTSTNAPLVAWIDGRVTNKQVRVAQKSGSTWGASIQVSDASAKPASLALAVKADGGVIAAWGDTRATPSAIWGAQCEAGTTAVTRCATAAKWSDQSGAAVNPTIAASAATVFLGWRDDTAGGGDFRLSRRVPS
jgi:hypothetical protein